MRSRNAAAVLVPAVLVAGIAGGGYALASHRSGGTGDGRDGSATETHASAVRPASSSAGLVVPSHLAGSSCDLEAVPDLPADLDPRVAAMAPSTLFAQALDPATADDQQAAVDRAVQMSSAPASVTAVATAKVPFAVAGPILHDPSHPLVAPTRCIWLVTVAGPYTSDSARPGATPQTTSGYTVAFDAASGEAIDFEAGPQAPSLITGLGLGG